MPELDFPTGKSSNCDPQCYFKLITHELPAFPSPGVGTSLYQYYSDDDPSVPGYAPVVQTGPSIHSLSKDGCFSVKASSQDGQAMTGSAGQTNYFHSAINATNATAPYSREWSFEFTKHKCCLIKKVYIALTDVDAPSESYDISAFSAGWVEAPENTVPPAGGGIYTATAQNQTFVMEWDVAANGGLPPEETIVGNINQAGQGVCIYLADYYVPLRTKQCDGKLTHYDCDGLYEGEVFAAEDIGGKCCADCAEPLLPVAPPNNISEPTPPAVVTRCVGPFTGVTNPSGWWAGWSPVRTANQTTETRIDWAKEHIGTLRSPDCLTDFSATYDLGGWYKRVRRARNYLWIDYQIVVNGTAALTRTNQKYDYRDKMQDTNPDVIRSVPIDLYSLGVINVGRFAVPAGAVVEIRTRVRDTVNGSQTSAYSRWIGGLRSSLKYDFVPRQLITEVT